MKLWLQIHMAITNLYFHVSVYLSEAFSIHVYVRLSRLPCCFEELYYHTDPGKMSRPHQSQPLCHSSPVTRPLWMWHPLTVANCQECSQEKMNRMQPVILSGRVTKLTWWRSTWSSKVTSRSCPSKNYVKCDMSLGKISFEDLWRWVWPMITWHGHWIP